MPEKNWEHWSGGRRESRRCSRGKKRRENLREQDSQDGGRIEMRAKTDILIEGLIMGLARKLALFSGIPRNPQG